MSTPVKSLSRWRWWWLNNRLRRAIRLFLQETWYRGHPFAMYRFPTPGKGVYSDAHMIKGVEPMGYQLSRVDKVEDILERYMLFRKLNPDDRIERQDAILGLIRDLCRVGVKCGFDPQCLVLALQDPEFIKEQKDEPGRTQNL